MRNSTLVKLPVLACLLALPWAEAAGADPEPLLNIFCNEATARFKEDVWNKGAKHFVKDPGYRSKDVETKVFEGFFLAADNNTELWVFSDDGVNVYVTDYSVPNPTSVPGLERIDEPQHLPSWQKESLWKVNFPFGANKIYRVRVEYRNKFHWGESDIDGCTLFATNGGGEILTNGLDLDVDGLLDFQEIDPGALLVRRADGNNAPRKKIILQGIDDVRLSCSSGKVKFFTTAEGDAEVNLDGGHKEFARLDLPKSLYVQGNAASETMADVLLTLTLQSDSASSTVKFTVLWVTAVAVTFSPADEVARDNDKRENYRRATEAYTFNLGLQKFVPPASGKPPVFGWGLEMKGSVAPAQFIYPIIYPDNIYLNSNLCLGRDWQVRWWDAVGNPVVGPSGLIDFSETTPPPGNDTTPREGQDHDPTDSNPAGSIYDWDAPGVYRIKAPVNEVRRVRANFRAFAEVIVDGFHLRASPVREYFVRFSIKQLDPEGDNWIVIDPPDVQGDKKAEYGTTPLTWDLQEP